LFADLKPANAVATCRSETKQPEASLSAARRKDSYNDGLTFRLGEWLGSNPQAAGRPRRITTRKNGNLSWPTRLKLLLISQTVRAR
jgi:hypothetical protein